MNASFSRNKSLRAAWTMAMAFAVFSISLPVNASLAEPRLADVQVVSKQTTGHETTQQTQQALERETVARLLTDYGFSPQEVNLMLLTINDARRHQLASSVDTLARGGDSLRRVVALLVIALLVTASFKLTDGTIGRAGFYLGRQQPADAPRERSINQRSDPGSVNVQSKRTRLKKGRDHRKSRPLPPREKRRSNS